MNTTKSSPLGRGLSALFGDEDNSYSAMETPAAANRAPKTAPVANMAPGKYQPRREFDEEALRALADSISEKGILQPILVRPDPTKTGFFEIVAGERRWRAAQLAGLHDVPVIVKELSDQDSLEIGIIENVQRRDLNPIEEAEGYNRLIEEFGHTQETVATSVGKSRSHIANLLRLLNLPIEAKTLLNEGKISAGHARALLSVENPDVVAKQIVQKGLTVRQIEAMALKGAKKVLKPGKKAAATADDADVNTLALEREIAQWLGLVVQLKTQPNGSGALTINYQTLDQLEDVLRRLNV